MTQHPFDSVFHDLFAKVPTDPSVRIAQIPPVERSSKSGLDDRFDDDDPERDFDWNDDTQERELEAE